MRRTFLLLILISIAITTHARWDTVYSSIKDPNLSNRRIPFWCGYFFNDMTGFVGGGSQSDIPVILQTTDGGATWSVKSTPFNHVGYVTSIHFSDATTGYASIRSTSFPSTTLWKTTNAGVSWQDITSPFNTGDEAYMCVWKTPNALISTQWYGIGGISTDDGQTWQQRFTRRDFVPGPVDNQKSNGIYFTDDLHGVVTMGPNNPQPNGNGCFFTNDGGLSWQRSWDFIEAWSVYGIKNTRTFFLAPEGDNGSNRDIIRSDDGGFSWHTVFTFPDNIDMTGHIDGRGNTLYIQVQEQTGMPGLYRSDDLGSNWKKIGGPDHDEDSRFCLAGCYGNIVFAFDLNGNIFKTSDGGDGTFAASITPVITISPDTIFFNSTNCQPDRATIRLTNYYSDTTCTSVMIDSIFFESNEFHVDTLASFTITNPNYVDVPLTFETNSDTIIRTTLRIRARNNNRQIDTLITVIGKGSQAPMPMIPPLASIAAGEELLIPILLKPTVDTFTMHSFDAFISYNTNLLSPNGYVVGNTKIQNAVITETPAGARVRAVYQPAITENDDVTVPIISLRMKTFLSKENATAIAIDTFSINDGAPLPLCSTLQSAFSLTDQCGDSVLAEFMRTANIPTIIAVRPNPLTGSMLEVTFRTPAESRLRVMLVDLNGAVVASLGSEPILYSQGIHTVKLPTSNLVAGVYTLCLLDRVRVVEARKVVEVK